MSVTKSSPLSMKAVIGLYRYASYLRPNVVACSRPLCAMIQCCVWNKESKCRNAFHSCNMRLTWHWHVMRREEHRCFLCRKRSIGKEALGRNIGMHKGGGWTVWGGIREKLLLGEEWYGRSTWRLKSSYIDPRESGTDVKILDQENAYVVQLNTHIRIHTHARTHAYTRARRHACTHARTHKHTTANERMHTHSEIAGFRPILRTP